VILTPRQMLEAVRDDVTAVGAQWALIGGWAVSTHVAPRTTEDIDFAVVADGAAEEDQIVFALQNRGYRLDQIFHHDYGPRAATVRLIEDYRAIRLDLLFNNSGIEDRIVAESDDLDVMPGLRMPVTNLPHLIAMKVVAGRPKDEEDLDQLIPEAVRRNAGDLDRARGAVRLIGQRGYHRDKDLPVLLEYYIREAGL
jgi:predicted nucleotidyltransferase